MAQALSGQTAILTIDYDRVIEEDLPYQSHIFSTLPRKLIDKTSDATTYRFGVLTGGHKSLRTQPAEPALFEIEDPDAPTRDNADVEFKWVGQNYRFRQNLRDWATKKGALTDVLLDDLEIMSREWAHSLAFRLLTSSGEGILFTIKTGASSATQSIENYAGYDGEELGALLETMLIEGTLVNWGVPDVSVQNSGTAVKITGYDATPGAETVTFASSVTTTTGDAVWVSRQRNGGAGAGRLASGDDIHGIPAMADWWGTGVLNATYQALDVTAAPRFQAQWYTANGGNRELDETLLRQAVQRTQATAGRASGEWGLEGLGLYCHPFTLGRFGDRARQDRRFNVPLGEKMLKFASGVDFMATTFMDVPFIPEALFFRNSVIGLDGRYNGILHKGPLSGQFYPDASPQDNHRVTGGTTYEIARYAYLNGISRKRNSNFWIKELITDENI